MSRPWMPLYVRDYLSDTARLSTLEHGAYLLLIMAYWKDGGIPSDDDDLAYIVGLSMDEWLKIKPRIQRLFRDGWRHKRIDEELAKAEEKYERRANAGRKGGLAKAATEHPTSNAKQCSSNWNQPQPQPQPQDISPSEVSNETSSGSSAALPLDATPQPEVVDLRKARERKAESDLDLLDKVTDLWNAWAKRWGSPTVERLTERRATHCRRRIADLKAYGHDSPEAAFEFLLSKCSASFYARGSPRKPLEFDQLMREDFMTRMLEGAFEYREARRL